MNRGWSILIGITCLLGAAYMANRSIEFRRHGEIVTGIVISVNTEVSSDDSGINYSRRAVVHYTPMTERAPRTMKTQWTSVVFGSYQIGENVLVRYLPDHPEDAREVGLFSDWAGPLILLVIGFAGFAGKLSWANEKDKWWWSSHD